MPWNKYHENLLKRWSEHSKIYKTMHSIASQYYTEWDRRLGIPVIILGAFTASSIFSVNGFSTELAYIMNYVNGSLALVLTALTGINKFLGLQEKSVKHNQAVFKYFSIAMEIEQILTFPRNGRRIEPEEFLNSTKLAILEVREHAPEVPGFILEQQIKGSNSSITDTSTFVNSDKLEIEDSSELKIDGEAVINPKSNFPNSIRKRAMFKNRLSLNKDNLENIFSVSSPSLEINDEISTQQQDIIINIPMEQIKEEQCPPQQTIEDSNPSQQAIEENKSPLNEEKLKIIDQPSTNLEKIV